MRRIQVTSASMLRASLAVLAIAGFGCTEAASPGTEPRASSEPGDASKTVCEPAAAESCRRDGDPGIVVADPIDDEAATVYDPSELRTYDITVAPADLATLDSSPIAEGYVPGTLSFEGTDYPVGVRYKGSIGAFLSPCSAGSIFAPGGPKTGKCSVKVSFNWKELNGRFFGLKKLNFHSMNLDPSLMRDRLGYALFREFGVPAPRAVHAMLRINGQLEGLFALVEQVDGRFTRARFAEGGEGNLYKEIWPIHDGEEPYLAALRSNKKENPSAGKMLRFKDAVRAGPTEMENWLDRPMTAHYIAADRVMTNDDGAFHWWCTPSGQGNNPGPNGNHNYYWYEAQGAQRMWLIPWDMDNSFEGSTFVHIDQEWRKPGSCACPSPFQQRAPSCDSMIQLWGSSWNDDYEAAVDAFLAGPFAASNVDAKLDAWESQIAGAVEASGMNGAVSVNDWQSALVTLRQVIENARLNRGYPY